MALIECRECGRGISSKSTACPGCGAPVKPKTNVAAGCLATVGIVVLIGILSSLSQKHSSTAPGGTSQSSRPTASPSFLTTSSPTPSRQIVHTGEIGVLRAGSSSTVILGSDKGANEELTKMAVNHDQEGFGMMLLSGRAFAVPAGTKVRVLDTIFTFGILPTSLHVRVVEGKYYGRDGFVPFEWVVPASSIESAKVATATPAPATYRVIGISKGDYLNVREGAGSNYPVIATLEPGTGGIVLGAKRVANGGTTWQEISIRGHGGWVNADYLALETQAPLSPTPSPAESATTKAEELAASNWRYSEQNDEMGRGVSKFAAVSSENEIEFNFPYGGSQRAKIQLQSSPDRKQGKDGKSVVLLIEKGQFSCGYPTCDLAIRFDDGQIQTFKAEEAKPSATGDALFFMNYDYGRLISSLRKSKKVRIEAEFYREGTRVLDFDVLGLDW
jgi:hypothetical protein